MTLKILHVIPNVMGIHSRIDREMFPKRPGEFPTPDYVRLLVTSGNQQIILRPITRPTEGSVSWNGVDIVRKPDELRQVLGYLPQSFGVFPNLSAQEILEYMSAVKGLVGWTHRLPHIGELLRLVNLTEVRKRPLGGYSGSMKQLCFYTVRAYAWIGVEKAGYLISVVCSATICQRPSRRT